jgi:hypothetical protein
MEYLMPADDAQTAVKLTRLARIAVLTRAPTHHLPAIHTHRPLTARTILYHITFMSAKVIK